MKNINCNEYKELIMAMVDGELQPEMTGAVNEHVTACSHCAGYKKDLETMSSITLSMKVEAPDYLETRIMAAINKPAVKPLFILSPAFSMAASFTAVLFTAAFLIYSNGTHAVQLSKARPSAQAVQAAAPVRKTVIASVKPVNKAVAAAIKPAAMEAVVVKQAPVEVAAVKQVPVQPAVQEAPYMAPQVNNRSMAQVPAQAAAANPNKVAVSEVSSNPAVKAADVSKVESPTPVPLLETEKAIVANNLINPNRGESSHIVINVEQPSLCRIIIYDRSLRVVSNILESNEAPGKYEAYWSGRNDNNQTVAEGVYFVYIQIGKMVIKKNIIVVK